MSKSKKILIVTFAFVALFMAFMTWYKVTYSQDVISSYEVNSPALKNKLLIASQGSQYKDALVSRVISGLKRSSVYIKVIDVTLLNNEDSTKWNAILIVSAVEMGKNQKEVVAFISAIKDKNKVVMHNTAGDGEWKDQSTGIDTMTSASPMVDVDNHAEILLSKIEKLLK